jgi:hypothetical protein
MDFYKKDITILASKVRKNLAMPFDFSKNFRFFST